MKLKPPIRLFVDAHTFDNEYQGSRTFIRELYAQLATNPAFELFIAAYDIEHLAKYFPVSEQVHLVKFRSRSSLFRLLIDIPLLVRRHRINYAHFQYIVPLIKNCRFIVTIHDVLFRDQPESFSWFYRFSKTLLYRFGASRADILTTDSSFSARSIAKYLHANPERTPLVPVAISDRFFAPYNKRTVQEAFAKKYGFDKFILYVSRIEPRKNHALLLRAFLELKLWEQGFRLVLLGHESIGTPAFDELLASLSPTVRTFVVLRSDIADDELISFYRAASVFIYPSTAEGFGIPPLEAAAAGTPVICSNRTALADFDFFGSRHIDPTDFNQLKTALSQVLDEPPGEKQLEGVKCEIKRRYNWAHSAGLFAGLIKADHGCDQATADTEPPYPAVEIPA
jgi:glycosyltransferase involved in cell wall biosynthesis